MDSILIVDDEPVNLKLAKNALKNEFFVVTVQSGKEALALIEKSLPDLLLLDIMMPEIDGMSVLRQLKNNSRTSNLPIIIMTGKNDTKTEVDALNIGAADFITKPFAPQILYSRVKHTLELNKLRTNLEKEVANEIAKRQEQLKKVELEMLVSFATAIDAKDSYTNGHSMRVAEYSSLLAKRLGKDDAYQERIFRIGLLHDIGKIGVPDNILNKNERLTEAEYEAIKKHTIMGSEILRPIATLPYFSIGARSHHERYDGKGYPDGISGENIPEEARIIAVADAYDAMTSRRVYRKSLPQYIVAEEIQKGSGSQFDPVVAACMLEIINEDTDYKLRGEKFL